MAGPFRLRGWPLCPCLFLFGSKVCSLFRLSRPLFTVMFATIPSVFALVVVSSLSGAFVFSILSHGGIGLLMLCYIYIVCQLNRICLVFAMFLCVVVVCLVIAVGACGFGFESVLGLVGGYGHTSPVDGHTLH